MLKHWPHIQSTDLGDHIIFKIRSDRKVSPRTGEEHDFLILECRDWVNVVAVTPDREMVMIEQYRHGTNTVELEIPGGVMDVQEETPVATAIRELREETGYEGGRARVIGQVAANPAIMNNTCHTILIEDCREKHAVQWDSGEDMITRLYPIEQIPSLVAAGKIRHSLVVVALYYFELTLRG